MGISSEFKIGEVVVLRFPFSDLSREKFRPAVVVGFSDHSNIIVSQITSKLPTSGIGIVLSNDDFNDTKPLQQVSYIRPNKIFTADPKLVHASLGMINMKKRKQIHNKITEIFRDLK